MARTKLISTYDYVRYGGLNGTVVRNEGVPRILPGMEATVDIHTGARTVIDYFLRPVLKLKSEAFRER